MSVDMDMVGVMAAYSNPWCVCVLHTSTMGLAAYSDMLCMCVVHTSTKGSAYAAITVTTSMSTDTIEPFL